MAEPILLFKKWVESKNPIKQIDDDTIECNSETLKLDQESGCLMDKGKSGPYSLKEIYHMHSFMTTSEDVKYGTYRKHCDKVKTGVIRIADQREIFAWLTGEKDTCDCIPYQIHKKVEQDAPTQKAVVEPEPKKDTKVEAPKPVVEYEILRSVDSLLLSPHSFAEMIATNSKFESFQQTQVDLNEERMFKNPIILVGKTNKSMINVSNIREFLMNQKWVEPEEGAQYCFTVKHYHSMNHKPQLFDIVADPELLQKNDWDYVVAVFLTGHAWQITKYKPSDPTDLFAKVLGIYIKREGEAIPQGISQWRTHVINLSPIARFKDVQIVSGIWNDIEQRTAALQRRTR